MDGPSEPDDVCPNCGAPLQPSDNFCPQCGTEIGHRNSVAADRSSRDQDDQATRRSGDTREPSTGPAGRSAPDARSQNSGERSAPGAPGTMVGIESPLRTIGVATGLSVAGILVPLVTLSFVVALLIAIDPPGLPVFAVVLTVLQFAWFVGLGVGYLRNRGYDWESIKSYFGIGRPSLRDYGLILVTWFVMIVVASIVGTVLVELVPELLGTEETEPAQNPVGEIIAENPELVLGAIVFMFVVVGPAEEILFRGVVQNRVRERFSKLPGIVIASFLFAVVHVVALAGQDPVGIAMTIAVLFVTSLGLGWIYEYTGNIVVPALLHGFHNSVIVAVTAIGSIYDIEEATLLLSDVLALGFA